MISVKNSFEIAYNGTENECRFELYADTAADLQGLTHIDGIKIQMGSECTGIATGDKYILNGSGAWILQPSDRAFSNVYTKPEIDSMITEIYGVIAYYHTVIVSDTGEITFYALAGYIGTWKIYGNGQQTGTPTPDNPVMPDFCGTLDGTDWTIPLTCAGQTTSVYLGQTQTVRRIKKRVLTGTESWARNSSNGTMYISSTDHLKEQDITCLCSHYKAQENAFGTGGVNNLRACFSYDSNNLYIRDTSYTSVANFKAYLAAQYANGTPVTIWYVLAEPTTGIVNEPLAKIGDYADELHSTDAGVQIPTVQGENTLTVDTELPPSLIEISGGIIHE